MVNKKSEYKVQFCKYDPDIGKRLWLDNRSIRACRKLTNQETHYWQFQICPEEFECTCTSDDPPGRSTRTRQSLLDKHRAQEAARKCQEAAQKSTEVAQKSTEVAEKSTEEAHKSLAVATQVPDKRDRDEVDHPGRPRGPSAPPPGRHLKPSDEKPPESKNKGVQTRNRKSEKTKAAEKTKAHTAKVTNKPPPSPKRRRSQSQLPPRTSKKHYPHPGADRWKMFETQKQTIRWMSEYQEQFSKHRDEFFSRSPVIRSRPTSAPPCTSLWSRP